MEDMICNKITKIILPAVRIRMAEEMRSRYNLKEKEIADILGINQVAISKYLNGKYSAQIKEISHAIGKNEMVEEKTKQIIALHNRSEINKVLNNICEVIVLEKTGVLK